MPLRINDVFCKDNDLGPQLLKDIFSVITTENGRKTYSGKYGIEEKKLALISYDLIDENTNEMAMKLIFTLQGKENRNEIIDLDVTIPNKKETEAEFIERENEENIESNEESEYWTIEYDDRRTYTDTVNKQVVGSKVLGKHLVSLSAISYKEVLISETMVELNKLCGFEPTTYEWQEQMGLGKDPISLGFGEDFVGMGMIIGKIESYKTVNIKIGDHNYEGIIVELNTGLGKLPALLPIDVKDKVVEGHYIRMMAELKADFAVKENDYNKETINV